MDVMPKVGFAHKQIQVEGTCYAVAESKTMRLQYANLAFDSSANSSLLESEH